MLDPKLLQSQIYVVAAATEGSFSRAARKLCTSRAFVARRIDEVERLLAVRLFNRSTRRLELTDAGRIALPNLQDALRHSERAFDLARNCGRIAAGPIRLGYSPCSDSSLWVHLYAIDFSTLEARRIGCADFPEPRLQLESAPTLELAERVLRGKIHAALGIQPLRDPELWVEPISREPFCACLPKNHRLARQTAIPIREFHGETLFFFPRALHPDLFDQIADYVHRAGAQPICLESHFPTQAIDAVAQGLGLALLPQSISRISRPGVVFRSISDRFLHIETALFARRDMLRGELREVVPFIVERLHACRRVA